MDIAMCDDLGRTVFSIDSETLRWEPKMCDPPVVAMLASRQVFARLIAIRSFILPLPTRGAVGR
jgi:hypothetical protein